MTAQFWRVTASYTDVASAVSTVIEAPTAHRAVALFARQGFLPAESSQILVSSVAAPVATGLWRP